MGSPDLSSVSNNIGVSFLKLNDPQAQSAISTLVFNSRVRFCCKSARFYKSCEHKLKASIIRGL